MQPDAEVPEAAAEEAPVSEEAAATEELVAEQTPAAAPKKRAPRKKKAEKAPKAKKPRARRSAGERKPIVRLPKPEHERGRRKERRGTVVSSAMDKTIVVRVDTIKPHPRYKKVVRRSVKLHAHDEANAASVGDVVRVVETRPLSSLKRWRLVEVVEAAK
jgi:small subunit ribosomal protein S17